MSAKSDLIIQIPKELLEDWNGISIDMGGSAIKIAFVHNDDLKENDENSTVAKIRLVIYRNEDLKAAVEFLREHCHIRRKTDEAPLVYTSGIGSRKHREFISNELRIKTENVGEFGLSTLALKYFVAHLPQSEFLHLPSEDMLRDMQRILVGMNATMQSFKNSNYNMIDKITPPSKPNSPSLPMLDAVPDLFPCLMCGITSLTWSLIIQKDDTYKQATISGSSGGLTFLGLGSLLCGTVKTYDELVDLAEKGDNRVIDSSVSEAVVSTGEQDDMYACSRPPPGAYDDNAFLFSKAAALSRDSFKLEDIIRALLASIVRQQCEQIMQAMLFSNVKHVFVNGSFTNRLLVRKLMENEFQRQKVIAGNMFKGKGFEFQIHFSKFSAYFGALGAMIYCSKKSTLPQHIRTNTP